MKTTQPSLWVQSILLALLFWGGACTKAGSPPALIKHFPAETPPITQDRVHADEGGWRIEASVPGSARLFEQTEGLCEDCQLLYKAKLKSKDLAGKAYLEMWVRIPGKGEFFSRGLDQPVSGTSEWSSFQIPFFLQKGQKPELAKLNVMFEGTGGTLWIKEVELSRAPLP